MQSKAKTVDEYLAELAEDRRGAIQAVRDVILKNLPEGYEEGMQYGMISYYVPHSIYPSGYHCDPKQPLPFAGLASQKNYMAVYLFCIYTDEKQADWFRKAWEKTGKKLNMGKSCVRFRKIEDCALSVIGQTVKRISVKKLIAGYESVTSGQRKKKSAGKRVARKKAVRKRKVG